MKKRDYLDLTVIGIMVLPVTIVVILLMLEPNCTKIEKTKQQPKETEVRIEVESKAISHKKKISKSQQANNKSDYEFGALPPVRANYRKYIGFKRYAQEMTKRGARFFIMGVSSKQLYQIDFEHNCLQKANIKSLANNNFSPRSRIISDEPALGNYLEIAKLKYGISNPKIVLLVTSKFEKRIMTELLQSKLSMNNIDSLRGFYAIYNKVFTLQLTAAISKSSNVPIKIRVNL